MEYLFVFLKGFAMGAANVIPGVSGGTIAFITGVYDRLINALKSCDISALKLILTGRFADFAKKIDLWFLVSLGLGAVTSILTLAKVLKHAYVAYPILVSAFFFGLILASIFSVARMVKHWGRREVVALSIGLAIAVGLSFLSQAAENSNPFYLAVCGVAAMCSMIIPGVSGSFILLLMGNYKLIMLNAVDDLRQFHLAEALPVLVPVGIGAVIGLVALSHVLSWLFRKYHDVAVSLITGFVAGSLVIIWPWKEPVYSADFPDKVITWKRMLPALESSTSYAALWIIIGIALIVVMEKVAKKPA